jgi:hypothetical protein
MTVLKHKRQEILNDMKKCFGRFGFPIIDEINEDDKYMIVSKFGYQNYGFVIAAVYHPKGDLAEIHICYGNAQMDKVKPLYELMNHINTYIMTGHFSILHETGEMSFRAAVHVPDSLDEEEFKWTLGQVMTASYKFFPMIVDLLFTEEEPVAILKKHLEREPVEVKS